VTAQRARTSVPSRARHALPPDTGTVTLTALGALVRAERLSRGLGTRRLAIRASVARSTVQRLEAGQLRPRRSLLSALALGLDADEQRALLVRFIAAAGGEDALAEDGRWPHYRRRRHELGILAGTTPLPAALDRGLKLHRQAEALTRRSLAILDEPGALEGIRRLDEAHRLHVEADRLRGQAGPPVVLHVGGRRISVGFTFGYL
jgi:transcriptional regulator with XRE-family HTH domain